MKNWISKKEGLNRTNKMRQKGSTNARIDFVNKGLVPLLEEAGYKLEFQYELNCRFFYIISWE